MPPRGDAVTRTSILLDLLNRTPGLPPGAGTLAEEWWRTAKSEGEELVSFLIRHKILSEAAPIVLDLVVEGTIAAAPVRLVMPGAAALLDRRPKRLSALDELRSLIDSPRPVDPVSTPPPTEFVGRTNPEGIETVFLPHTEIPAPDLLLPELTPAPPNTLLPESLLGGGPPLTEAPTTLGPTPRLSLTQMPAVTPTPILLVPETLAREPRPSDTKPTSDFDSGSLHSDLDSSGPIGEVELVDPSGGLVGLPAIGTTLGRCLLLEQVGEGATGVVFRALHKTLNIPVAVKVYQRVILAAGGEAFTQLRNDARLLVQLNHANVVRLWDFEDDPAYPYTVMEFVEGMNLADLIAHSGRLQPNRAVAVMEHAATGLKAIAALGIVHRDVKPGNILLTRVGDAKVSDVGLAIRPRRSKIPPLVGPAGTAMYMSPEQGTGAEHLDLRSDIYSLGVTFYHALTGRPPFAGKKSADILVRHLKEAPKPPHEHVPGLDPIVSEIVLTMLAKDPAQRYQTYDDLLDVLREIRGRVRSLRTTDGGSGPPTAETEKGRGSVWGALRSSLGFGRSDPSRP